jgi:hypothetical protein
MKSAPLNRIASLNFAIVVCLVGGCNETRVNKFEDKNDGVLNELIMKGWLPHWIPDDAKDILEKHNVDTNAGAFSFHTQTAFDKTIKQYCETESNPDKPREKVSSFSDQVLSTSQVYKCDRFLIVYRDNQVFGWTTGQ